MGDGDDWMNNPFSDFSVLLGCEVAGCGRYVEEEQGPVHLINELGSVMLRYVFLIPTSIHQLPSRKEIEPAMLSAFKKIAKLNAETPTQGAYGVWTIWELMSGDEIVSCGIRGLLHSQNS